PPPTSTLFPYTTLFRSLLRKADSQLDFDLELAKKQSTDNPVFYVQYAHARIASVLRQAADAGVALAREPDLSPLGDAEIEPLRRSEEHTSELQSLRHLV